MSLARTPDVTPLGGFPSVLGVQVDLVADGSSEVRMAIGPGHLNYEGVVHGGVISSLADTAIARAIRQKVDEDKAIMTVSLAISFVRAATKGTLIAKGVATSVGRSAAFGRAEIRCGDTLVAEAQGTWLVRSRVTGVVGTTSDKEGSK